jgi:hypothetical protein
MARPNESRRRSPEDSATEWADAAGESSSTAEAPASSGDGDREAIWFLREQLDVLRSEYDANPDCVRDNTMVQSGLISV